MNLQDKFQSPFEKQQLFIPVCSCGTYIFMNDGSLLCFPTLERAQFILSHPEFQNNYMNHGKGPEHKLIVKQCTVLIPKVEKNNQL